MSHHFRARPVEPEPPVAGKESVWDYPRPPRVEPTAKWLRVELAGQTVAETRQGLRVLETASPPAYYFPSADVRTDLLRPTTHRTVCEWKGLADHFDLVVGRQVSPRAAWSYAEPIPGYGEIAGYVAFYPDRVDGAYVGEQVRGQAGGYYGGWIRDDVVGPFKGGPGTEGW